MFKNKNFMTTMILGFLLSTISYPQTATLDATFSLKEVDGVMIPYQNGIVVPSFEKQDRTILNLAGEWKKQRFSASDAITLNKRDATGYQNLITEAANRYLVSYDDSGWETKNLPAVENTMNTYPATPEFYQDGVWYRKTFTVDALHSDEFAKLMFYAVNYVADVWLNDVYLGYHEGGYTPFAFDVSSILNIGGNNTIAVRIDNPGWAGRNDIVPYANCDWFNYTGLIHDVYIEFSNPVSVIRTNIVPQSVNGDFQTTVILCNKLNETKNVNIEIEVYEADVNQSNFNSESASGILGPQHPVAGTISTSVSVLSDSVSVWQTNLSIANPKLWSMKNPNLYVMKVKLTVDASIVDEYYTQFGIRKLDVVSDKFYLNNQTVFLTGVARHEDHPTYGRSIPIDTIYSDMVKVKGVNATSLRTAHYPNHLQTYLLADRLGIAIIEEIPVFWFDTEEAWNIQNNQRHIHEQMFREMVFKDYNRPSIFLWSTANECLDVPNRKIYIERVNQDLKQNYNDGRFITQSAAADRPGPEDDSQTATDVMGWTMYFGIFYGNSYFAGTNTFINNAKTNHPSKPILDTEFGYWSSESGSTTQKQIDVFNNTFLAFSIHSAINSAGVINANGALMGCTWWCVFDWYTNQQFGGYQSMGLYKMDRITPKPVANYLKTAYLPYFNFGGAVTDVEENEDLVPKLFSLKQNYPNPFNPETKIVFNLPVSSNVKLKVYDILGNEITTLVNEFRSSGRYEVNFTTENGVKNLSSGIYFYKLDADEFSSVKKMIYLK